MIEGGGPITFCAELVIDVVTMVGGSLRGGRARRAAAQRARLAQQRQQQEMRRWMELIARQSARVTAGDASPGDARAALGGRGGRGNPLDRRRV